MSGRPPNSNHFMSSGQTNGHSNHSPVGGNHEDVREDEISLRDILETLLKGKWIILGTFLTVVSLVGLYTFTIAPEYESRSTILINTQQPGLNTMESVFALGTGNRSVHNEVEILRSRSLAERVADRLMSAGTAPGSSESLTILEAESDEEFGLPQVTERLRKSYVQIRPMGRDVDMIEIKAASTQPAEASYIANLFAEEYVRRNIENSRSRMHASREFLEEQESQFHEQLQETEDALRNFLEAESVVALDEEAKLLVERSADLQAQRAQAQVELEMAQARLVELEREVERIEPGLLRRISSGLEGEISALQREIAELEMVVERIYSRNPTLRGNEDQSRELSEYISQVTALREQVDRRSRAYYEEVMSSGGVDPQTLTRLGEGSSAQGSLGYITSLRRQITDLNIDVSGHQARVDVLAQRAAEYERQFDRIPSTSIRLAQLQRSRQANEQLYLFLVEKLQEARVAEQSELGYVEIVDEAAIPLLPVRPRKLLNLLLGAIVGMMLGVGFVFVQNAMDNRIRRPEDLRKRGLSVLGVVPSMARTIKVDFDGQERITVDGRSVRTTLIALLNPLSPIAESYRRLRTNIQFSKPDHRVEVVMITSSGPGEGKTSTALNLAITLAQSGKKTVYVDTDLRRPAGHSALGIRREPGLVEALFDGSQIQVEDFATDIDNLYAIPAGSSAPNPAELLGSQKMKEFVIALRREFDVVVFDTPPVLPVTDAILLSHHCDAAVIVVSAGETDWQSIDRTIESLQAVDAPIIGVVVNRFDPSSAYGYYGQSYGYGYYDYYGESRGETQVKKLRV